ncbi:hypothetical protein, partial [Phocaeicola massiliensis]|uniref:hypothetical protein n=1 Tax=Phocaeicola massiliensis TaxID=204516 RepID=UPI001C37F989
MKLFSDQVKKVCGHNILRKFGSLIILGDLSVISQAKGRISRFPGAGKVFLTEDYYSLRQWTVQS